jgi:hypothetical protein
MADNTIINCVDNTEVKMIDNTDMNMVNNTEITMVANTKVNMVNNTDVIFLTSQNSTGRQRRDRNYRHVETYMVDSSDIDMTDNKEINR